jgi:hypothetical protein
MLIVKAKKTSLKTPLSSTGTSFKLTNLDDHKGNDLALANFGTWFVVVLKQGDNVEMIKCDGLTQNSDDSATCTVATSGRHLNGTSPYAGSSTGLDFNTGAEAIITNDPLTIMEFARLNNDNAFTGANSFTSFPTKSGVTTPTAAAELATKAYVDATATGAAAVFDQNIITGVHGETLVAGDGCYFKTSDSRWWKWDADAAATSIGVRLAVAQTAGAAGVTGNFLIGGLEKNLTGLTAGSAYYASGTAGAFTTTRGAFVRYVGRAVSTTRLVFDGNYDPEVLGQLGQEIYAVDAVGTDAYAITLAPAISAYKDGMVVRFKAATANTGNATLAINGLVAKNILKNHDQTLADNDIEANQIVEVVYDGTQDKFVMQSQLANSITTKFGGDGSDGALLVTSGTTTIDLTGLAVFIKQYTSIEISGTGAVAFSNPHADGTIIILKSQGAVTITSSATRAIDLRGLGSSGGAGGTGGNNNDGTVGSDSPNIIDIAAHGGGAGAAGGGIAGAQITQAQMFYARNSTNIRSFRTTHLIPGTGGGGGECGGNDGGGTGGDGGAGARGAGALYIECAGAYNVTGTIDLSGSVGSAPPAASWARGGNGGGGSGGMFLAIYGSLTADSGTYTVTGGAGGTTVVSPAGTNGAGGGGGGTTEAAGSAGVAGGASNGSGGTGASGVATRMLNGMFA